MKDYAPAAVVGTLAFMALAILHRQPYLADVLILVCMYGALSVSWNLAAGFAGLLSLGHSLFFGIGAYAVATLGTVFGLNPWYCMAAGIVLSLLAALVIGSLCFRYNVRGYYFGIATLAFSEIAFFLVSATLVFGRSDGLMIPYRSNGWTYLQFNEKWPYGVLIILLLLAIMLASASAMRGRSGSYWRAIRDNEEAADALGVPVMRYKIFAFLLSAAFTSLCGSFFAVYVSFVDPRSVLGVEISLQVLVFSIIGGMRKQWGPVLGAALLVPVGEFLRISTSGSITGLSTILYAVLLMVLSLTLPQGVGGWLASRWGILRAARQSIKDRQP